MKNTKYSLLFSVLLLSALVTNNFAAFRLHRYHTSLTRMDYKDKEKIIETSMQLFTHDLVPVLEERTKKKIDLEKTPDVDRMIFDYLSENFILKDNQGIARKIKWVGKEIDVDTIWVYLEISCEQSPENNRLQNTTFFESFPEQTNLVTMRFDDKKSDLLFKAGDKFKEIKPTIAATEN